MLEPMYWLAGVLSVIVTLGGGACALAWRGGQRLARIEQTAGQAVEQATQAAHQVTQNHHSSSTPTVLDKLDTVHGEVAQLRAEHRQHVGWAEAVTEEHARRINRLGG